MTQPSDRELEQWMRAWQSPADIPAAAPEAIYRHVRRRSRLIRLWLVGEVAVLAVVAPLIARGFAIGNALERVAMMLLALIGLAAIAFSWWNWRGTLRTSGASTAAFLALSRLRVDRLSRAVTAGWVVLVAEVLVFVPWIALRLYGGPAPVSATSVAFSWGLLAAMTLLGVAHLLRLARWARNERAQLDAIEGELLAADPHV
jgi:hypothetical protein